MTSTVILCLLSTISFCLCARGLVTVALSNRNPMVYDRRGFSAKAWRLAHQYTTFALAVLALASLAGAVSSYIELFS